MVECQACGISLDEARAVAAAEAASMHGGFLMCAGCRDAADLQRKVDRLETGLREVRAGLDVVLGAADPWPRLYRDAVRAAVDRVDAVLGDR